MYDGEGKAVIERGACRGFPVGCCVKREGSSLGVNSGELEFGERTKVGDAQVGMAEFNKTSVG